MMSMSQPFLAKARKGFFKMKWIILGVFGTYISSWTSSVLQNILLPSSVVQNNHIYTNVFSIFYAILLAPIIEETLFRNVLIPYLKRKHLRYRYAIMISAGIFTLVHLDPWVFPYFINGCIYGVIKVKTKDNYSSIICHSVYNLLVLLPILIH